MVTRSLSLFSASAVVTSKIPIIQSLTFFRVSESNFTTYYADQAQEPNEDFIPSLAPVKWKEEDIIGNGQCPNSNDATKDALQTSLLFHFCREEVLPENMTYSS